MSSSRLKLNEEKTEIVIFKTQHYKGKLCEDRVMFLLIHHKVPETLELPFMKPCLWLTTYLQHTGSYSHYLKAGLSKFYTFRTPQLNRLQRILNNAAMLVTLSSRDCHISDITYSLHWLPIKQRINFKILLLTFQLFNSSAPSYKKELLK